MLYLGATAEAQQRQRLNTQQRYRVQRTFESAYYKGYGDGHKFGKEDYRDRVHRDCREFEKYHRSDHGYMKSSGALTDFQ